MNDAVSQTKQWLERVVIGLNLCPFAATPYRAGRIRIVETQATASISLLTELRRELQFLDNADPEVFQTSLLVVTAMLQDFDDYNDFLDLADTMLRAHGWEGVFQIASFHPQYQFAGTEPDDAGNLTNRSPWPVLHIIREASIDAALLSLAEDPDEIPARNIQCVEDLTDSERRELFPWLFARSRPGIDC
jgi:uncharacterized protein